MTDKDIVAFLRELQDALSGTENDILCAQSKIDDVIEEIERDPPCYCRCGVALPAVADHETPFEFCSVECSQ